MMRHSINSNSSHHGRYSIKIFIILGGLIYDAHIVIFSNIISTICAVIRHSTGPSTGGKVSMLKRFCNNANQTKYN